MEPPSDPRGGNAASNSFNTHGICQYSQCLCRTAVANFIIKLHGFLITYSLPERRSLFLTIHLLGIGWGFILSLIKFEISLLNSEIISYVLSIETGKIGIWGITLIPYNSRRWHDRKPLLFNSQKRHVWM